MSAVMVPILLMGVFEFQSDIVDREVLELGLGCREVRLGSDMWRNGGDEGRELSDGVQCGRVR